MADLRQKCYVDYGKRLRTAALAVLLLPLGWSAARGVELPAGPALAMESPAADKVVDVRIRGNKSLPLAKILPHIRTRPGRTFDLELIEEDVRRLDQTRMFVDVKTYWQDAAGGKIVIFDVLERPLLREVKFVGCKEIRKKTLQKEAEVKVGDPVDPFAIEEARRKLEELYRSRGFAGARVTLLEGDKPEDRRAIFLINEGTKQKVWKVQFVGNTIASGDRLQTQIKTAHPFLWLFKGELDRKQLDEDVQRLTAYYRGLGFFRARIGREMEFNEKQDWVTVTFVIDEGPRYKVRNVSVLGNTKYKSDELTGVLKLKDGEYFNQAKMTADVTALQDKYGGIGYVFADIKADPRFLEEPGQLDLVYNIKEGDRYVVGKINVDIRGEYPHTQITTILNRMSLRPGDIVDIRELRASERRIRASGLFESNPAAGNAPKIVFSPPGQENEDPEQDNRREVARRPKPPQRPTPPPGGNFRGQSPDGADRQLDITLDCGRYIGPKEEGGEGRAEVGGMDTSVPTEKPAENDLMRLAGDLRDTLAQRGQSARQSPSRLILTQYTSEPQTTNNGLRWTSGTASAAPQYNQTSAQPAQYTPAQPAPAYGQSTWPRTGEGPQRPVETPQGPYVPGPIFSESSPFRDGPPDGGENLRPLPLDVRAEEAMTGRVMLGVGVNSDSGLVGSVVLDEQNFDWTRFPNSWEDIRNATAWRGAGQRFRLEAVPGTQVQRYMATFQEPYLFNTAVSLGLSGYFYNRIYTEYTEQRLGGRVALGYQFSPDLSGNIAYRGAKINISRPDDPALPDLAEVIHRDIALHGFQLTLTHDKRDSAFLATEGHLIEASVEEVLGTFQYPHAELDIRKYFTLYERPDGSGRHVLSLASRVGWTGENTPIYERYYAGGFSTLRGFQFRGASPAKVGPTTGEAIFVGGDFMMLASAEYLFPITADDMIRGVVFCDTGTVEPTINHWSDKYRVAPGFGLRIAVPAMGPAPIALDFAFPVSWQPGDKGEMFSFFMGFNR